MKKIILVLTLLFTIGFSYGINSSEIKISSINNFFESSEEYCIESNKLLFKTIKKSEENPDFCMAVAGQVYDLAAAEGASVYELTEIVHTVYTSCMVLAVISAVLE